MQHKKRGSGRRNRRSRAGDAVSQGLFDRELRQRAAGQGQSTETERQHRRHKQDLRPKIDNGTLEAKVDFDSFHPRDVMALINAWLPLTFAMNCLNRSMGQPDLYPFVLSQEVIGKLGYIDALVHHRVAEVGDAR
jgi:Putative zinc-binding metallo-peptidase